ncbi:Predicted lipoprotein with conserved Yx(FWY)xxD motif [Kaistia soli DSM 19436]|uniref:Predicted lipoprotein with conserved Yx(FWY)xxD motif n=1 Tax=Kaistia soli DSM 19436 TaxID=1122133 RepID=A0A1M5C260_9HYPH|nr:hypothetical protein [Kaistia soli]SHF48771.1 Predicted lipoprotein with conserved Yx(FWY)xxD motif [Kaistia soli DSM 19436]
MLRMNALAVLMVAIAGLSSAEAKTVEPVKIVKTQNGRVLADPKGMTLYTFDKDHMGRSECTLLCAAVWPPLMATKGQKPSDAWTLVKRANGSMQWAYKGRPLYTYRVDMKPGDISGEGVEGEWHIAKP